MFWKYIFPLILVAVGVATYFLVPYVNQWIAAHIQGFWGLLWLDVAGIALWLWLFLGLGFRGGALKYATIVILFTAVCLWLIANWEWFTAFLELHLGQWGMIGVLLLIIIIVGLGLLVLF